jgi:hypothetical protein
MSVVVFAALCAVIVAVAGLLAAMFVKDEPIYGAAGVLVLLGPGTVLPFVYLSLS